MRAKPEVDDWGYVGADGPKTTNIRNGNKKVAKKNNTAKEK